MCESHFGDEEFQTLLSPLVLGYREKEGCFGLAVGWKWLAVIGIVCSSRMKAQGHYV